MKSRLVLVTAPTVVVMGATLKKSRHSARPLSKVSSGAPAAAASSSSSNAPESEQPHVVGIALVSSRGLCRGVAGGRKT